ncbi:hypothetical protein [Sneathiella litorea]|uniref:PH domain-containing protein n=1 Tax=Sneathiella litorea TaxID=2606216 RepID=A0A6L8W5W9_9PROT|nr:hypothetical protein [Sneathiella litorea]MZR29883.1 hypothetical protein [Sneathiella litorea]
MIRVFTYPRKNILGSYLRALVGVVLTAVPLLLLNPISVIVYLLVFLLCAFIVYGLRAIFRQFTRFEVSGTGIVMTGPLKRSIKWAELDGFNLNYYSTRRDREAGWMHLRLIGGGAKLSIDSTINEFEDLVRLAARAAAHNGVVPNRNTTGNLQALGITRADMMTPVAYGTADR